MDTLKKAIVMRAGQPDHQYDSVGLLDHGRSGEFCLLKKIGGGSIALEDFKTAEGSEITTFLQWIASYVKPPKELGKGRKDLNSRIDLMGCCLAEGEKGMELITYLEDITGVNWSASTGRKGAEHGLDWEMETEPGLECIAPHYFDVQDLKLWTYTARGCNTCAKCGREIGFRVENPNLVQMVATKDVVKVAIMMEDATEFVTQNKCLVAGGAVALGSSLLDVAAAEGRRQLRKGSIDAAKQSVKYCAKSTGSNIKYVGRATAGIGYAISAAEILKLQGDTRACKHGGSAAHGAAGGAGWGLVIGTLTGGPIGAVVGGIAGTAIYGWFGGEVTGFVCDQFGCATLCEDCFEDLLKCWK